MGSSRVLSQPSGLGESEASLGYARLSFKKEAKIKHDTILKH